MSQCECVSGYTADTSASSSSSASIGVICNAVGSSSSNASTIAIAVVIPIVVVVLLVIAYCCYRSSHGPHVNDTNKAAAAVATSGGNNPGTELTSPAGSPNPTSGSSTLEYVQVVSPPVSPSPA
jgi:hypothetical protein